MLGAINHHTLLNDHSHVIEQAVYYHRGAVFQFASATELARPFNVDELTSKSFKSHQIGQFISDISFTWFDKRKNYHSKHSLLGHGLHNITEEKKPV